MLKQRDLPMVLPYRKDGPTVGILGIGKVGSRIYAERRPGGRIWVKLTMLVRSASAYRPDAKSLPLELFTSGVVIPDNQLVGVRFVDEGDRVAYGPALWLVSLANDNLTHTYWQWVEIASLALGGLSGVVAKAAGISARAALALKIAEASITGLSILVNDHRYWFVSKFGPGSVAAVDIVSSLMGLYSGGRLVAQAPSALRQAQRGWLNWAAKTQRLEKQKKLSKDDLSLCRKVKREFESLVDSVDSVISMNPRFAAAGVAGDFDVWEAGTSYRMTSSMKNKIKSHGTKPAPVMGSDLYPWTKKLEDDAAREWDDFVPQPWWRDMRHAPPSSERTSPGNWPRNSKWFWQQFYRDHWSILSPENQRRTSAGRAAVVDDQWIEIFPAHKNDKGSKLVHHHIERGPWAAPIPERYHEEFSRFLHFLEENGTP